MPEWLLQSLLSGSVAGLIAWGGLRVEIAVLRTEVTCLRRDVDYILEHPAK